MKAAVNISSKRVGLLLKNELLSGYKNGLIAIGAVIGTLLIINLASVSTWNQWNFNDVFFPITLFVGGIVATSVTFGDLHSKQRGYTYLTLPASMFEKFLSKLLFTTVGYCIIAILGFFVFSLVAAGLTRIFFGVSHKIFNPFQPGVWKFMALYIVSHSIFFFGAVFFKKQTLVKTVLSMCGIAIVYALLSALVFRIFFGQFFRGITMMDSSMFLSELQLDLSETVRIKDFFMHIYSVVRIVYWYVLPPVFWVLTGIKLRETEAK